MTRPPDMQARIQALVANREAGLHGIRAAKTGPKAAEVYLYDPIGGFFGITPSEFVQELKDLDDDVEEIQLHVNSPGGSAFDGIAILNALRQHPARVVAVVDGIAASAASFIACGADEVVMSRNSEMMVHDASGICMGPAAEMHKMAEILDKLSDNIASIYAEKAGGETAEWRDVMREEAWYTAEEAVEAGLADRSDEESDDDAKNRFDLSIFAYAGRDKAPAPRMPNACRCGSNGRPAGPGMEHKDECSLKPPAASADGLNPTKEGATLVDLTDEQIASLREQVGFPEDADAATITAAVLEALAENADDPDGVPDGHVVIPEARLKDLEASATLGAQAAERMRVSEREAFLNSNRTKFVPANREAWAKEYDRDPEGTRAHFENAPDIIPVDQLGHDGDPNATQAAADDADYAAVYPDEKKAS